MKTLNPDIPSPVIGQVIRSFKPSRANLVAGGILGVLLLAGGVLFASRAHLAPPQGFIPIHLFGVLCVAGGLVFVYFTVRLSYMRIDVCERGLRHASVAGVDEVAWDEVDIIQVNVAHIGSDGYRTHHVDPYLTIRTAQGKAYCITANHVMNIDRFVKAVTQQAVGHEDMWEATSKTAERSWAVGVAILGVFTMAMAPMTFLILADAERKAGGEPVRVHWVVYILYNLGGKWLAAAGVLAAGGAILAWGVSARMKVEAPPPIKRRRPSGSGSPAPSGPVFPLPPADGSPDASGRDVTG